MGRLKQLCGCVAISLCLVGVWPAAAQNPFAVKRIVNTSVITNYDISQRVRLLRAFGVRGPEAADLALQQLTEDRLKLNAAEANGIGLQEGGYEQGLEEFAARRGASAGGLLARMRNAGVSDEADRQRRCALRAGQAPSGRSAFQDNRPSKRRSRSSPWRNAPRPAPRYGPVRQRYRQPSRSTNATRHNRGVRERSGTCPHKGAGRFARCPFRGPTPFRQKGCVCDPARRDSSR